ncbi:Isochorismatase hydrolase [Schizophyllum commune Tattone D]|nr:Isochorismatase hydrolase [Schizophyllum commune Tattone D]
MPPPSPFRPALLVIDMQNDFCLGDGDTIPDGALAVQGGRDIIPVINDLLSKPAFVYRVATRDWHPRGHVSFAENHGGKRAFVDEVEVVHPDDAGVVHPDDQEKDGGKTRRAYTTRLWPTHCVQGTWGAQLVDAPVVNGVKGLDTAKVDLILDKGTDARVEMYSAFYDPLRVEDSGLARRLREVRAEGGSEEAGEGEEAGNGEGGEANGEKGITHVYVVGLAYDYCVRATALDARAEGFEVVLVRDATRAVDLSPEKLEALEEELEGKGVKVRGVGDEEVRGWLG